MLIKHDTKETVGSRGGKEDLITIKVKRIPTHRKISIFAAREGLTIQDAIDRKFSDVKE